MRTSPGGQVVIVGVDGARIVGSHSEGATNLPRSPPNPARSWRPQPCQQSCCLQHERT